MGKTKTKKTKQKRKERAASEPAELTDKEKTKQELLELGKSGALLVDGAILILKGLLKVVTGLLQLLFAGLKFSLDGFRILFDKAGKDRKTKTARG